MPGFQWKSGMNKFIEYMKERQDIETIDMEKGFICYRIEAEGCMILDHYVLPEFRRQKLGKDLADKVFSICRELGIKTVFCQLDRQARGARVARINIVHFGFEPYYIEGTIEHYKMEVESWVEQ